MAVKTIGARPVTTEVVKITGEELHAMGDIGPCELIDGRIIPMSPAGISHGIYEMNFALALRRFADEHDLGVVATGEVGIYTRRDPDSVRGADVVFISHERDQLRASAGFLDVAPELVVEIISPDDKWSDVIEKLREYFAVGVKLVWVADPELRSVLAYRSLTDVREFTADDDLVSDDVLPGFRVNVADLFRE